jgi:hypothetical protein
MPLFADDWDSWDLHLEWLVLGPLACGLLVVGFGYLFYRLLGPRERGSGGHPRSDPGQDEPPA